MADMESRSISNFQLHSTGSLGQYLSDAVSQISPSISISNSSLISDNFQSSNCWIKMSECDEFIGPKLLIFYAIIFFDVIFLLIKEKQTYYGSLWKFTCNKLSSFK